MTLSVCYHAETLPLWQGDVTTSPLKRQFSDGRSRGTNHHAGTQETHCYRTDNWDKHFLRSVMAVLDHVTDHLKRAHWKKSHFLGVSRELVVCIRRVLLHMKNMKRQTDRLTARRWRSKQKNKTKKYTLKQIAQYFGLKTNLLLVLNEK